MYLLGKQGDRGVSHSLVCSPWLDEAEVVSLELHAGLSTWEAETRVLEPSAAALANRALDPRGVASVRTR